MAVTFDAKHKKPWLVEYRNNVTGSRLLKRFSLEEAAREFDRVLDDRRKFERSVLRKKRKTKQGTTNITVKELLHKYFELAVNNQTTLKTEKYHANPLIEAFGFRQASLMTSDDILNFILIQKNRGLKLSTIYARIRIFRRAISWGKKTGILKINPLAELVLPKSKVKRSAPPSPKEAEALLTVAPPHIQRVIILGWNTGARIGPSELFRLAWSDVDLEYGIFRMPSAKKNPSSADARDIPISIFLLPIIRAWRDHDTALGFEHVINYRGKQIKSIGKAWRKCLEQAKIRRPIRPYDLRHAYATYALLAGAKLKIVADIMDHADPSMILRTYQYTDESERREAVEAMPDHLQLATQAKNGHIPGIGNETKFAGSEILPANLIKGRCYGNARMR